MPTQTEDSVAKLWHLALLAAAWTLTRLSGEILWICKRLGWRWLARVGLWLAHGAEAVLDFEDPGCMAAARQEEDERG